MALDVNCVDKTLGGYPTLCPGHEDRLLLAALKGLFGPQASIGHRVVFDDFEVLGHRPDGAVDTLGYATFTPLMDARANLNCDLSSTGGRTEWDVPK